MKKYVVTFLLIFLIISISRKLPVCRKWICLRKSDYVSMKTRVKLMIKFKIMQKYGGVIGFALGGVVSWVVFEWQDGKIISIIKRSFEKTSYNFICAVERIFVMLKKWVIFLSPYGRIVELNEQFQYALNWSTGGMIVCLIFCMICMFFHNSKYFLLKIMMGTIYAYIVWYAMYGLCYLIVKIPVCYKILAPICVIFLCTLVGMVVLSIVLTLAEILN